MEHGVLNLHEELIEQCRRGDRNAFYRIYQLYSKAMYNVCYRITGDEDDADDALQEAFISAFRHLHHYRGDATFGSWLKRIVVNKSINLLKRKRADPLPDSDHWDVAEEEVMVEDNASTIERIKKAMAGLPDGYRSVLSLYLLEGYDHQEIAEIMGITESTSKSQLNRAKSRLREMLESDHVRDSA